MIEPFLQWTGRLWVPSSPEDIELCRGEFSEHQIARSKLYGVRHPRSVRQINTYFRACQTVAENMTHPQWNRKDKVDFSCRVACHFVDPNKTAVRPDGTVQFSYRSIAFKNLKHISACNYFEQAFEVMAAKLSDKTHKVTVDQLLQNNG